MPITPSSNFLAVKRTATLAEPISPEERNKLRIVSDEVIVSGYDDGSVSTF
jgi:hypothetical protein